MEGSDLFKMKRDKTTAKKIVFQEIKKEKKYGLNRFKTFKNFAKRVNKSKKDLINLFE